MAMPFSRNELKEENEDTSFPNEYRRYPEGHPDRRMFLWLNEFLEPGQTRPYTYEDYITWEGSWELAYGRKMARNGYTGTVAMAGAFIPHNIVRGELELQLRLYLKGKKCRLFSENFDVKLKVDEYDENAELTFQPDILIVCDPSKIADGKKCVGAPDFIIEVLSPSSSKRDKTCKRRSYEKAGVREYWIADPSNMNVDVYILEDGKLSYTATYGNKDHIPVHIFEDCSINLEEVFESVME